MLRCALLCISLAFSSNLVGAEQDGSDILLEAQDFSVTANQVDFYIDFLSQRQSRAEGISVSASRLTAAILELYGLAILSSDAIEAGILVSEERVAWLSGYLTDLERVRRYVNKRVEEGLQSMDFDAAAAEYYSANRPDYVTPRVRVRTLLVSTKERTVLEAIDLTRSLVNSAQMSPSEFEELIISNTDDDVAKRKKGLMTVREGDTVKPFEEAAFALDSPGQLSGPVISQFGVHTIQLVEKLPPETIPFNEVKADIKELLRAEAERELRQGIITEAQNREPEGYAIHEEAIDSFMSSHGFSQRDFLRQ